MSSANLNNLVKVGQLKLETFDQMEFAGLIKSGKTRLKDAKNVALAPESRFDLAYNAAHSLGLAALRWRGYRADNRYIVFQALPHTAEIEPEIWRVLAKCHNLRNVAEYEGYFEVDDQLLRELIIAAELLLDRLTKINNKA